MSAPRYVLHATVRVHNKPVGDCQTRPPHRLLIDQHHPVDLPLPADVPFVVRAGWRSLTEVVFEAPDGSVTALRPEQSASVELGPVSVDLTLVRQVALRRTAVGAWVTGLSWFVVVFAFSLFFGSEVAFERTVRCTPLGDRLGLTCPSAPQGGGSRGFDLELLERMLRKDYDGVDAADPKAPSKIPEFVTRYEDRAFLPAGDEGPITERGGAEQVAASPRRQAEDGKQAAAASKRASERKGDAEDDGGVVAEAGDASEAQGDAEDGAGMSPDGEDDDAPTTSSGRAEEKKGWGVRDWLDAAPPEDKRVVDASVQRAKRNVRIDPDDPAAIGLLAYYQYLQEDYVGAEKSFDRVIELEPEMSGGYNNKALIYKRLGQYGKEEGLYRLALAMDPDEPTALNNLAVCLAHQGRYSEALAIMDKLERLTPNDPYTWLHRSKILAARGDDDQSLAWLRKALQGSRKLDLMHHVEFRQDLRLDPAFARLRKDERLVHLLEEFYGADSPLAPR